MVLLNGLNTGVIPHHRQNRRRERPGSRSFTQADFYQDIADAHDSNIYLPSDNKVSPILRQTFDQSWARWKAREAEEKALAEALAEVERMQKEEEEELLRMFGGESADDDELFRLGILYDGERTHEENDVKTDVPIEQAPAFVVRPGRRNRHSRLRKLQLFLSLSDLSNDADIARYLSHTKSQSTIQHRHSPSLKLKTINTKNNAINGNNNSDIRQSLPPTLKSELAFNSHSHFLPSSLSSPFETAEDWTFITPTPHVNSPVSETETWILLGDDS
ncbi:hypothetical protein B0O99DRAFT_594099 [Bisporella sp. PMI_857]|nr:hypothetical protein B0O99DRAFT_594099 [Bisporella sp. PMI_857]